MNNNTTKVIVPCRFSYLHCWEPDSVNGGDPKYSVSAIIDKKDTKTINAIKAAIEQAKKDSVSKWGGKVPTNLKLPLRDGDIDRPDDEAYAGCYFFNASCKSKPGVRVLDGGTNYEAMDSDDFYSGCYGAVTINFFPYENRGNKGVAAGLNDLIKTRDGERLSGGRTADEDFGDMGGGSVLD